jgi:signal transduction histidine kinase
VWLFALLVGFFVTQLLTENRRRGELIAELENVRSELTESYHEAGVQSERYRLAQEIHDTVGQGLTSLLMLIRAADAAIPADPERARERLALAQKTATDNLAEVRAVISASGPAGLSASPLDVAIGKVVARLAQELDIEATAEVIGEPRAPSTDVQVVLLRAVQEALANVRKHAQASRVRVRVRYHARSVQLEVSDNGRGFVTGGAAGFGLAGMRARVEQVSGMMTVSSTPGSGTTITIEVTC